MVREGYVWPALGGTSRHQMENLMNRFLFTLPLLLIPAFAMADDAEEAAPAEGEATAEEAAEGEAAEGEKGGCHGEKKTNTTCGCKKPEGEATGVPELSMVGMLVDWGRDNNSAEALTAAAQILSSMPATAEAREKKSEAGEGEAGEKEGPELSLEPQALLDEAIALADAQGAKKLGKHLAGLTVGNRGAAGGPKYTVERVKAYETDMYFVTFNGLEYAQIGLSGDGDTDLDLYVYDENGNQIASDLGSTDDASVSFTPAWTGTFRIEVKNLGGVYNQYVLITN
jgi:hypothetical protein